MEAEQVAVPIPPKVASEGGKTLCFFDFDLVSTVFVSSLTALLQWLQTIINEDCDEYVLKQLSTTAYREMLLAVAETDVTYPGIMVCRLLMLLLLWHA